jgi:mandelate racemase
MNKIEGIRTTPVLAPLPRPLRNASGYIERFPLVLIELTTTDGVSGHAYADIYFPELLPALDRALHGLVAMVRGSPLAPRDLHATLVRRLRLFGTKGVLGVALGGLDMAIWDAYARGRNEPLCATLGAAPRAQRPYHSVGLYNEKEVVAIAEETLAKGYTGLKIKLGFPSLEEDLAAVRAAQRILGSRCALMVDYNQSLSVAEALRRCHALDDEGLTWIEEPVLADDLAGNAAVAAATRTPIQIGENFNGPGEMRAAIAARAMDYVMPDAQFIWGVTGWLEAAALARTAGLEMSSHLFTEASAHLLSATPTAHWLEYMDVTSLLLAEPQLPVNGMLMPSSKPGIGIEWDPQAVEKHRVA